MAENNFVPPLGSNLPTVFLQNVENFDLAMNSTELTWPDRAGNNRVTLAKLDSVVSSLDTASFTFDSISAGLNGTSDGQYFRVPQGVDSAVAFIYYRNSSGEAIAVASLGNGSGISSQVERNHLKLKAIDERFMTRDGVDGFILAIMDPNGRVVGFTTNGGVKATHLNIPGLDSVDSRDVPLMIPVIQSTVDGRIGIGFNPGTGKTFLLPDEDTIKYINEQIAGEAAGYLPPTTLRGGFEVSAVRKDSDFWYALVQEKFNLKTFDVKQKINSMSTSCIPDRVSRLEIRGVTGQSNAVLAGTTPVRESRALFPFSALSFEGKFFAQGGSGEIDGNLLTDFSPVYDAESETSNQLPATMGAFASEFLKRDIGGEVTGQIVFTAGQGSVAMSALLPGTVNWKNYFSFLSAAKRVASTYKRQITQRYVTIIQGENGTKYASDFGTWADAVIPQIKSITEQTDDCKIALWQITGGGNGYENGVGVLQLNFLDTRADVVMPGPMYGYPTVDDRTHLNAYGRMMMGECQAYMELMISNGFNWKPLRMKSAIRSGKIITVTVDLPPGTRAVSRDYGWMPDVIQDGFIYANNNDGTISINSVVYSDNKIILTLSTTPTSTNEERVVYGMHNSAGSGWAWYGGMAMAESAVSSPFYQLGHPVPEKIRHYLLRERIGVTL